MEIKSRRLILLVGLFVGARVAFFYLTSAEWGDSYHFLRAAEYISHFSYPLDEKRLPLFPLILSPAFLIKMDALLWGRFVVLGLSVLILLLTYKLANILLKNPKLSFLAAAMTAFSPPFFYWTGKIYAEALFTVLVLLSFIVLLEYKGKHKSLLLGLVCGLAFMTRFEGFLLFLAVLFRFFQIKEDKAFHCKSVLLFFFSFGFISAPYFAYRFLSLGNISSPYFLEPSQFSFNLKFVAAFFSSLIFLFGFIPFFHISSLRRRLTRKGVLARGPIFVFVILELLLAFVWQAAIPRLFVPIIPLAAIAMAYVWSLQSGMFSARDLFLSSALYVGVLILFAIGRFYLHLQFLVPGKLVVMPLILSAVYALSLIFMRRNYAYILILAGFLSSVFVAFSFRNVYKTIYQASVFAESLKGKVAYSDETGVPRWYLRNGKGLFYGGDYSNEGEYKWLRANGVSYIIDTNEHNEGSKLEVFKDSKYMAKFKVVRKFKSNIGVSDTFSVIYKVL